MVKKYKRLTNAEKKRNQRIKKELMAEGILPPPKKRLNRKAFIDEARAAWYQMDTYYYGLFGVAMAYMLVHSERGTIGKPSLEAVGAAKVILLTKRIQEFETELKRQGKKEYSHKEQYDYIKDILEA